MGSANSLLIKRGEGYFEKADAQRKAALWVFLAPFTVLFVVFTIVPILISFYFSLTNYNLIETPRWVGLFNFKVLFMDDEVFTKAMRNTLIFAVFVGPLGYAFQFFLAWFVNGMVFRKIFTLAFYAPTLAGGGMYMIWQILFANDRYGYMNNILINLGIVNRPVLWLNQRETIQFIIILVTIFSQMGLGFIVMLAGMRNVPGELYEAGRIDGVGNRWQELFYLTIPMMKPQMLFAAVNSIISAFLIFDQSQIIAGFPSQNHDAHTLMAVVYDHAFIRAEMGYAYAVVAFLFITMFSLSRIVMRVLRDNT